MLYEEEKRNSYHLHNMHNVYLPAMLDRLYVFTRYP